MGNKYRITFYDGPESNRFKRVDVVAENFEDARRQAWQMDEAKYREYSDMSIERVPDGPAVIGVEYEHYDSYFKRCVTDRVFIKAYDEAEAVKYFNEHFSERGRPSKTYFAGGCGYDADATIDQDSKNLDQIIDESASQVKPRVDVKNTNKEFEK